MDPLAPDVTPHFIGGFVDHMTGNEYIEDVLECYTALSPNKLDVELVEAISELKKNTTDSEVLSAASFTTFIQEFPQTLATCQS